MFNKKFRLFPILILTLTLMLSTIPSFGASDSQFTGEIVIAHTTDTHGYATEDSSSFGYAKLASTLKNIRSSNPKTILLDSGDFFEGQAFANIEKGQSVLPFVKEVGYDAMTTGNHDYAYGLDALKAFASNTKVPLLAANVVDANGKPAFQDYIIRDFDGFKVGIFGLANENTPNLTIPEGTKGLTFKSTIETSKLMVSKLKSEGADYIIALSHLGSVDVDGAFSMKLAEANTGVDLILDGHSHVTNNGKMYGDTMLVASGYYTKNVNVVTLSVENGKEKSETVKTISANENTLKVTPDAIVDKSVKEYQAKQSELFNQKLAAGDTFWNGEKYPVRVRETNLGRLVANSYLEACKSDIALVNGGGIRGSILPGDVTLGNVFNTQPFGNYLVTKEVTGKDMVKIMESALDGKSGGFLQVAGIRVNYDSSQPVGSKVISIESTNPSKPFNEKGTYIVATNNYIATHDSFPALKNAPEINQFGSDYEATANFIKSHGMTTELAPALLDANAASNITIVKSSWPIENVDAAPQPMSPEKGSNWLLPARALLENDGYTVSYDHKKKISLAKKEGAGDISFTTSDGKFTATIKGANGSTEVTAIGKIVNQRILVESSFFENLFKQKLYDDTAATGTLVFL